MRASASLAIILGFSFLNILLFTTCFDNKSTIPNGFNFIVAAIAFFLYLVFVALLPMSSLQNDKFAGIRSLVICFTVLFGLEFCGFQIMDYVINHMFYIAMAAFALSHVLYVCEYLNSLCVCKNPVNPLVRGGHWLSTFYLGREVRPFLFGKLDLKMYVNRIAVLTTVLIDFTFLYKSLLSHWSQNLFTIHTLTLVILVFIRALYNVDGLVLEHVFETSWEVQSEGFGYTSVAYLLYPFLMAATIHKVHFQEIELEQWRLLLMVAFGVTGYIIYRVSNDQMYAFRKSPSSFSGTQVIATSFKEKKLLCSGLWGVVRHPNYLGDILMHIAFTSFTIWIPAMLSYLIILFLLHRSYRNNKACQEKYGKAWDQYCSRVKYIVIPFIY